MAELEPCLHRELEMTPDDAPRPPSIARTIRCMECWVTFPYRLLAERVLSQQAALLDIAENLERASASTPAISAALQIANDATRPTEPSDEL